MKLEESTVQAMDEAGAITDLIVEELDDSEKTLWRILIGFNDGTTAPVQTFRGEQRTWAKSDTVIAWAKKHCQNSLKKFALRVKVNN